MDFQQGISGMNTTSRNLAVIGNNIANANTYGSKSSRAEFADMVGGSGKTTTGMGVRLTEVSQSFSQGGLTSTDNPLDMAISGSGFFQLKDEAGLSYYSRNGQFKVNSDGYIVTSAGMKLQGFGANTSGVILPSATVDLQVPSNGLPPQATTKIDMEMNLDSRALSTAPTSGTTTIDFNDPTTFNNATSMSVYDVKGQEVALTVYFQRASTNSTTGAVTWNVFATANGQPTSTNANGQPAAITQVVFPLSGAAPTSPAGKVSFNVPATSSTINGVSTKISEAINGIQLDVSAATQFGSNFNVTTLNPDGYAPGQINGVQVGSDGTMTASYSNGKTLAVGQVQITNFRNPQGLQAEGGNVWTSTINSGTPISGTPGSGSFGELMSNSLESSNVDMTAELVNMIVAQRAYQANAQTIKTQDQVLQTLVSLR